MMKKEKGRRSKNEGIGRKRKKEGRGRKKKEELEVMR
jgi:hypothetical protein